MSRRPGRCRSMRELIGSRTFSIPPPGRHGFSSTRAVHGLLKRWKATAKDRTASPDKDGRHDHLIDALRYAALVNPRPATRESRHSPLLKKCPRSRPPATLFGFALGVGILALVIVIRRRIALHGDDPPHVSVGILEGSGDAAGDGLLIGLFGILRWRADRRVPLNRMQATPSDGSGPLEISLSRAGGPRRPAIPVEPIGGLDGGRQDETLSVTLAGSSPL